MRSGLLIGLGEAKTKRKKARGGEGSIAETEKGKYQASGRYIPTTWGENNPGEITLTLIMIFEIDTIPTVILVHAMLPFLNHFLPVGQLKLFRDHRSGGCTVDVVHFEGETHLELVFSDVLTEDGGIVGAWSLSDAVGVGGKGGKKPAARMRVGWKDRRRSVSEARRYVGNPRGKQGLHSRQDVIFGQRFLIHLSKEFVNSGTVRRDRKHDIISAAWAWLGFGSARLQLPACLHHVSVCIFFFSCLSQSGELTHWRRT